MSFLKTTGSSANSVTPHSQSSSPTDPWMICTTFPAYLRPISPCPRMNAARSAAGRSYQFTCSPRRFDIG